MESCINGCQLNKQLGDNLLVSIAGDGVSDYSRFGGGYTGFDWALGILATSESQDCK